MQFVNPPTVLFVFSLCRLQRTCWTWVVMKFPSVTLLEWELQVRNSCDCVMKDVVAHRGLK